MTGPATTDWLAWHAPYDDPGSLLRRRLGLVQGHVRSWLAERADEDLRVLSVCAGQGRDLLEVLAGDQVAAARVQARLVELDPANVAAARRSAQEAGLGSVEVVCADAGETGAYAGAVPADLVLLCGVLGNVADEDVERTIAVLPEVCAPGATVIWTRSRRPPDLTPQVRSWFGSAGFAEQAFDAPDDVVFTVGVHRLVTPPRPFEPGRRIFRFVV